MPPAGSVVPLPKEVASYLEATDKDGGMQVFDDEMATPITKNV